jgi:hypothetical protein
MRPAALDFPPSQEAPVLSEVEYERDEHKASYLRACKTIAEMHAAAVGEVRGPIRGVVEDVHDLRSEYLEAMKHLDVAWGVIANAGGWAPELPNPTPGWLEAAQRWRDQYHEMLSKQTVRTLDAEQPLTTDTLRSGS